MAQQKSGTVGLFKAAEKHSRCMIVGYGTDGALRVVRRCRDAKGSEIRAALRLQIAVEPIKVASADLFMPGTEDIVSDKLQVTSDKRQAWNLAAFSRESRAWLSELHVHVLYKRQDGDEWMIDAADGADDVFGWTDLFFLNFTPAFP